MKAGRRERRPLGGLRIGSVFGFEIKLDLSWSIIFFLVFWSLAEGRISISPAARTAVLIGFFGAFTTFSSFILETSTLLRDAEWLWALSNLVLENVGGLICVLAGLKIGRFI